MAANPITTLASTSRREAGFTLVEVMVAMLLTAIAVVGMVGLFMVETRSSSYSRHNTEAAVLCEDKMEFLRTQANPATGTFSETGLDELGGQTGMYNRSWTIVTGVGWLDYTVSVSWSEDGLNRTVTLRSRRGL